MDRTEVLLSFFDKSGFGLEVGPGYNPLLRKSLGFNVETVDYADAATLRIKYKDIDCEIEEVTYVSDGRGLLELIGQEERYDFIVASHVIEHVTDIVRFLQDCSALLKPDGVLILAVPDKRFCFDAMRPLSTVGDALQAYIEKRVRHTPGTLFDSVATSVVKDGIITWREPQLDGLSLAHPLQLATDLFRAAQTSSDYHDVHSWRFTPSLFRYFIKTLRALEYFEIGESQFVVNDPASSRPMHEFYMALTKEAPTLPLDDLDLLKETAREVAASHAQRPDLVVNEAGRCDAHLKAEIAALRYERDALLASTSWRMTAPFRAFKNLLLKSASSDKPDA